MCFFLSFFFCITFILIIHLVIAVVEGVKNGCSRHRVGTNMLELRHGSMWVSLYELPYPCISYELNCTLTLNNPQRLLKKTTVINPKVNLTERLQLEPAYTDEADQHVRHNTTVSCPRQFKFVHDFSKLFITTINANFDVCYSYINGNSTSISVILMISVLVSLGASFVRPSAISRKKPQVM